MSSDAVTAADAALRADIRRLGTLLGQTPGPPGGPGAARPGRGGPRAGPRRRRRRPPTGWPRSTWPPARKLARAFSTYFHLANITEQVHRARELRRRARPRGRLAGPGREADRRAGRAGATEIAAAAPPAGGPAGVHRAPDRGGPPLDPDQAARRSPTSWTPRRPPPRSTGRAARPDAHGAHRPPPGRADRPAVADRRAAAGPAGPDRRGPQRRLLPGRPGRRRGAAGARRPGRDAARSSAWRLPPTARPLTFGTWIGGDRDGNPYVTPAVTRDVLLIQHEHGIRAAEKVMDDLIDELSVSRRLRAVSLDLSASLAAGPRHPARAGRSGSAGSTPRSRTGSRRAASRRKLANTRARLATGTPHVPGRDYLGTAELIADLELMRASLARNAGAADRDRQAGLGDPVAVRLRPAPGHAGRPRARRRAPRGARPAVRAGSAR